MQDLGAINIFKPRFNRKKVVAKKEVTLPAKTALASVYLRTKLTLFLESTAVVHTPIV